VGPVDLTVEAAECICLSGPSGAGKTLLLRAIADLDPHEGTVWLDDRPCEAYPAPRWRRLVGLLPAESRWWYERVGEHMERVPTVWLEALGFTPEVLEWEVRRASSGERQRLALLRLLSNRPRAVLLDEPTASLDPENTRRVEALISRYRRERQAPVLWVSHDPEQIQRIADRRFRLEDGKLLTES